MLCNILGAQTHCLSKRSTFAGLVDWIVFNRPFERHNDDGDEMALTGLKGTEHIGLTVPNLDDAVRFFVDVLGGEELFAVGPYESDDDWMTENLNVDPRSRIDLIKMVRVGDGPTFELFEYQVKDRQDSMPRNSDLGGHHIAFYVDDIDRAVTELKAAGLLVLGQPKRITDGPSEGLSWVYFLSPWGLQMEVVSYPHGIKAYEQNRFSVWSR